MNGITKVHAKIHDVKQQEARESDFSSRKQKPFDPTKPVADDIASNTWLICFDEFQVCSMIFTLRRIRKMNNENSIRSQI